MDIEIEQIETWPQDFKEIVNQNKKMIISYHREQKKIFNSYKDHPVLRMFSMYNRYEKNYQSIIFNLEPRLVLNNLTVYHCTRLIKQEIDEIKKSGMKVLSSDLVNMRFKTAIEERYLSQDDYNYLKNSPCVEQNLNNKYGERAGMIWAVGSRSILKDCNAVYRLFRSWGGEAVYCGHENDNRIAQILSSIGTPCIIKCALPFSDIKHYNSNFTENFLSFLISNKITYPDPPPEIEVFIKRDIKKEEVLEIIEVSSPLFEELTHYSQWDDRYKKIEK